jgi:trehalose 6-phosphate phosphatase
MPPGSPHKGTALLSLMIQLQSHAAVYVGDDQTDEDVFQADRNLILGIRIGMSAESRAQWYLNRQGETLRLLQYLVRRLDGARNIRRGAPAIRTRRMP